MLLGTQYSYVVFLHRVSVARIGTVCMVSRLGAEEKRRSTYILRETGGFW